MLAQGGPRRRAAVDEDGLPLRGLEAEARLGEESV
jgi:hypothetical protein